MKLFNRGNTQPKKQWSIVVIQAEESVQVIAVDSITGKFIARLLVFSADDGLVAKDRAGEMLNDAGYDTTQNGNLFNSDTGNIWVRNEGELE